MRDRLLSISGLRKLPPALPLVDDLIFTDTLAQLSGQAGKFKTFVTLGMSCSLALGRDFGPFAVPTATKVVYVAAEGASSLFIRTLAWCQAKDIDPEELEGQLLVNPAPIQLGNTVDVSEAVDVVQEAQAGLLVLDTRARCTLGLDENSATEQGKAIDAADQIRQAAGSTVLDIHHTSREGKAGRGSNAWDGAVWSDLRIDKADALTAKIHCEKHKDVPDGCDHYIRLTNHLVTEDLAPEVPEKLRRTLVVSETTVRQEELGATFRPTLLYVIETSSPPEGLTGPQLLPLALEAKMSKSTFYRILNWLVDQGYVERKKDGRTVRHVRTGKEWGP